MRVATTDKSTKKQRTPVRTIRDTNKENINTSPAFREFSTPKRIKGDVIYLPEAQCNSPLATELSPTDESQMLEMNTIPEIPITKTLTQKKKTRSPFSQLSPNNKQRGLKRKLDFTQHI